MRAFSILGLIFSTLLTANTAFALGAKEFKTVDDVRKSDFYRLTCSDTKNEIQAHAYVVVEKGVVAALKIVTVAPALSLKVIQYSTKDLQNIVADLSTIVKISGERDGAYWNESFNLKVYQGPKGMIGTLSYDDGDGMALERRVECGAVNYILGPRD